MKKETILKVLKYLGVACIGAFVGMGALIGVSSCSSRSNKQLTRNNVSYRVKHNAKHTLTISDLTSDNVFYAVAKNYAQDGEGVFYQGTITLENSRIMSAVDTFIEPTDYSFTLINGIDYSLSHLRIVTTLDGGVNKLDIVSFFNDGLANQTYVYFASRNSFQRQNCAFVFKNLLVSNGVEDVAVGYLNELFDIYLLDNYSFSFQKQFNYNAPYGSDIDSLFVNDSSLVNPSDFTLKTIVDNVPFYSGGYVFDTIQVRYFNAMSHSYIDDAGERRTWTASGFGSYSFLEYKNSVTNYIVIVNTRLTSAWNVGNSSGLDTRKGSTWVSDLYRDIQFFLAPSQKTIVNLTSFNNTAYSDGFIDNSLSANVGLTNVFDLLRLAFTSWIPIFNIQIIPGITIGLMIFLPLITGIILFIIWLVKR